MKIERSKHRKLSVVYKATNLRNGRIYVGSTIDLYARTKNYKRASNPRVKDSVFFHRALRKYGFDAFEWEIIEPVEDEVLLRRREQYWIDTLDPFYPRGYNTSRKVEPLSSGRLYTRAVVQIDKTTLKVVAEYGSIIAALQSLGLPPDRGAPISGACNGRVGSFHGYYWASKEDYETKGFSSKPRRKAGTVSKTVLQFTLLGEMVREWPSAQAAAKSVGCEVSVIRACCRRKIASVERFCWCYKSDYISNGFVPDTKRILEKPIFQICVATQGITQWPSAKSVEDALGWDSAAIQSCCAGRYKTSYGFVWRYVNKAA